MVDIVINFYDENRRNIPTLCEMWYELYLEGYVLARKDLLTDINNATYRIVDIEYSVSGLEKELSHHVVRINR